MKSFFRPVIAALALASTVILTMPASAQDITSTDFQRQVVEPTVQVDRNCSGTFVLSKRDEDSGKVQTLILTAKHCVEKKALNSVIDIYYPIYNKESRRYKEELLYGKVTGKHFKYDLAIIELVDEDNLYKTVAEVAPSETVLQRFTKVYASGYPMALTQTITEGSLNQRMTLEGAPYKEEIFVTTVPIAGGSSGGGLYAKVGDKYVLIGVASMGTRDFPYALWVPFDHVVEYLNPYFNQKKVPPQTGGMIGRN